MPDIEAVIESPRGKYITFTANGCGYNGVARELIVNLFHPLSWKAKAAASKEDNPN